MRSAPGRRPSAARSVAITTGALVAARAVVLVAGVITLGLAAHYLGLEHFGALTAAMAYASLFALLSDLGLSTIATREIARDPADERVVLGGILAIGLVAALGCFAAGVVLMGAVYPGSANAETRRAIAILLVQVFAAPITATARTFFTSREQGYLIASGDLAMSGGMALLTAIAVASHDGYEAVVAAITAGYVLQAAVMSAVALRTGMRVRPNLRAGTRITRLGLPIAGTLLINYLYFRLDVFLLSWLKGDIAVARYGLAYRVLEGLMVLPAYVMLALFPAIARGEDDRAGLATTVGSALAVLESIALPVGALVAIFSPELVLLLGGPSYAGAAPALALLALALALSYVNGVFGNALMAMGHGRALLRLSAGPLAINLALNLALIPPLGIDGAAVAVVFSELVALVLVRRCFVRLAAAPPAPPHAKIATAGLVLALLAIVKFSLDLRAAPGLIVVVGSSIGAVLYAALLLWLGGLPADLVARLAARTRSTGLARLTTTITRT